MKNVHVLPTDKPSKLVLDVNKNLSLAFNKSIEESAKHRKHIYITSDEEIKEGDYYISILENEVYKATKETQNIMSVANLIGTTSYKKTHFKIILTTDQDLIKEGVQVIGDEFLEWFVKNPSCEFVKIIDDVECLPMPNIHINKHIYKIIIPKEEQMAHNRLNGLNQTQTSLEWLINQYCKGNYLIEIVEQAKEMEKQQIIDAYNEGLSNWDSEQEAEQYYNETFKKK